MPKTFQPFEYSGGGGTDGASYVSATRTATSMSGISTGMASSGIGTTIGSTTTGMSTTRRLRSQLSSFLRPDFCRDGVLLDELIMPTAELLPCARKRF